MAGSKHNEDNEDQIQAIDVMPNQIDMIRQRHIRNLELFDMYRKSKMYLNQLDSSSNNTLPGTFGASSVQLFRLSRKLTEN